MTGSERTTSSPPRIRECARAVVTDRRQRILLVYVASPSDPDLTSGLWECPGGGVDPGESLTEALARELYEEVGLTVQSLGEPVWWREHHLPLDPFPWDGQRDTYFWVEVDADGFEPRSTMSRDEQAAEGLSAMRWWTLDEVQERQAIGERGEGGHRDQVVFGPRRLGTLLPHLLTQGRPLRAIRID